METLFSFFIALYIKYLSLATKNNCPLIIYQRADICQRIVFY